jgi:hypothetical protein
VPRQKSQPDIHAAGIILHRNINELFQTGEFHDWLEPFAHFLPGKSQQSRLDVACFFASLGRSKRRNPLALFAATSSKKADTMNKMNSIESPEDETQTDCDRGRFATLRGCGPGARVPVSQRRINLQTPRTSFSASTTPASSMGLDSFQRALSPLLIN